MILLPDIPPWSENRGINKPRKDAVGQTAALPAHCISGRNSNANNSSCCKLLWGGCCGGAGCRTSQLGKNEVVPGFEPGLLEGRMERPSKSNVLTATLHHLCSWVASPSGERG